MEGQEDAWERTETLRNRPKHVLMERSYLNGWRAFMKHTEDILPKIQQLVRRDPSDINGQMAGLRALSACKFAAPSLRDEMVSNALKAKGGRRSGGKIYTQAIVDGLVGLSECPYKPHGASQFVQKLAGLIDQQRVDDMTFL